MKRFSIVVLLIVMVLLSGCSIENGSETQKLSEQYSIGYEIDLGGVKFNIYKIDDTANEIYLLAQRNVATTPFSDNERSYGDQHDYEGSLVEGYVNRFVDELEDKGYVINSSGIIDKDDLYNLGFEHSVTISGRPYLCKNVPDFVKTEETYWVGGYYKVDTYQWAYFYEKIDTESCDKEYGVRPIVVINPSEIDKKPQGTQTTLPIQEIVGSGCLWTSEGGISNPYDRFFFDLENMTLKYTFESPTLSNSGEYSIKYVDEKTIQADGLKMGHEYPVEIIVINENKLRVRFIDQKHNDGDYYLNKVIE